MTTKSKNKTADVVVKLKRIAKLIERRPGSVVLDRIIKQIAYHEGDWIYSALTDFITGEDAYPQQLQDTLRKSSVQIANSGHRLSVIYMGILSPKAELVMNNIIELLNQLLPSDYSKIKSSAKLSGIEYDVWYYWLKGYTPQQISKWLYKQDGTHYQANSISHVLFRAWQKVWNSPYVAWRTCLAEDIARGKQSDRPNYVSWSTIIQGR